MSQPVDLSQKRVLVLGRSGQVATALAGLAGQGWLFAGRERADLSQAGTAKALIESAPWDAVINASAYTAVDKAESEQEACRALNTLAPVEMARACAASNVPFIHISTDYVFNGTKPAPYTETDTTAPLSVYGATKEEGERLVLASGGRPIILRTSWVYAPKGQSFLHTMLRLGAEREELRIVSDQIGAPTAAADIASGIVRIAEQMLAKPESTTGLFHMTGSGTTSWHGFAQEIFRLAALRGIKTPERVIAIPAAEYPTPAKRPLNSRLDCTRLREEYGVTMPCWMESLEKTMDAIYTDAQVTAKEAAAR